MAHDHQGEEDAEGSVWLSSPPCQEERHKVMYCVQRRSTINCQAQAIVVDDIIWNFIDHRMLMHKYTTKNYIRSALTNVKYFYHITIIMYLPFNKVLNSKFSKWCSVMDRQIEMIDR